MNILVLGGAGGIGAGVVQRLMSWGHAVTIYDSQEPSSLPKLTFIRGDRNQLADYDQKLIAADPQVIVDINASCADHVTQVVETFDSQSPPRFVLISSAKVYRAYARFYRTEPGTADIIPLLEDDPLRELPLPTEETVNHLPLERALLAAKPEQSTVLRIAPIYSRQDSLSALTSFVDQLDSGVSDILLAPEIAEWRLSSAFAEDAALAIALASKNSKAAGKIYNVADSISLSRLDFLNAIIRAGEFKGSARISDSLAADTNRDFSQHLILDSSAIRKDLGFNEQLSFNEALKQTIERYLSAKA